MQARERDRVRKALFWQGFGMMGSGCYVHPSADLAAAFDALMVEGLFRRAKKINADGGSRITLWALRLRSRHGEPGLEFGATGQGLSGFCKIYEPILESLRADRNTTVSPEQSLLLRILLIHDYRRLLLRDLNCLQFWRHRTGPGSGHGCFVVNSI